MSWKTKEQTSTLDSPDQERTGFPVKTTSFDGSKLLLDLPGIAAKYKGEFQTVSIVGTLTQIGMSFPMTFKRNLLTYSAKYKHSRSLCVWNQ